MMKVFSPLAPLRPPLWRPGEVYRRPGMEGKLLVQFVLEGPISVYGLDGPLNSEIGGVVMANREIGRRAVYAVDDPRLRDLVLLPVKVRDTS